jgi:hypothetical protein
MGRVGITTAAVAALVAVSTGTSTAALPMPALPAFLQATETRDQTFARRQAAAAHVQAGIELLKEHKVDEAEQRFRQAIALARPRTMGRTDDSLGRCCAGAGGSRPRRNAARPCS